MWEYVSIGLILISVPMFRVDGPFGLDQAKNSLFIALTGISFMVAIWQGLPHQTSLPYFFIFAAFATISLTWSYQPRNAMKEIIRLWATFWFYIICSKVNIEFLLTALFLPAPAIAAYGLIQQWFRYDPFDKRIEKQLIKKTRFLSFFGNSNYAAIYLAPQAFVGAYLTFNTSLWFLPGLLAVIAGIIFSRCRAAVIGVITGIAIIMPELIPLLIIMIILAVFTHKGCIESIWHRGLMIRSCILLWKAKPVFGWGPLSFRRKIYRAIAELNKKDKSILGNANHPGRHSFTQARRAHNDYAETLTEYGAIGFIIFIVFLYHTIQQAIITPWIMAGIITVIVNAFFFYPFRDTGISLPFFAMAGAVNRIPSGYPLTLPLWTQIAGTAVIAYIIYLYAIKPFLGNHFYTRDKVEKALEYEPYHNSFLYRSAVKHLKKDDFPSAFTSIEKAIHNQDGEGLEWDLLNTYGKTAMLNGAYKLAHRAFQTSIQLNPANTKGIEGLKQAESILIWIDNKMKKVKINGESG